MIRYNVTAYYTHIILIPFPVDKERIKKNIAVHPARRIHRKYSGDPKIDKKYYKAFTAVYFRIFWKIYQNIVVVVV